MVCAALRAPTAATAVAVLAALAGCAGLPRVDGPEAAQSDEVLHLDGRTYAATWFVPRAAPAALLALEPGFARRCGHLRETARRLMAGGMLVLCVDAPMANGNPALADALAQALAGGLAGPGGAALPTAIVVGGHSAGAVFDARLGARLAVRAPQRLRGALLFDPVAAGDFDADLLAISAAGTRPVLAVSAAAGPCNAQRRADPALRAVAQAARAAARDGFVGVALGADSTHVDVEGEDSDWIGVVACGRPQPANSEALRRLAVAWAAALAAGAPPAHDLPPGAQPIVPGP